MNLVDTKISVIFYGPEASRWVGILIKISRENDLFSFSSCSTLQCAQINASGSHGTTIILVHESKQDILHDQIPQVLTDRPKIYLAEDQPPSNASKEQVWLGVDSSSDALEKIIIRSLLRFRDPKVNDQVEANEIVGRAAHDLKSPLAAIIAYCQVALDREKIDAESRRFFSRIEANARAADDLIIRHMTDFRAARGQLKVVSTPTCLRALVSHDLRFEIESIIKKGLACNITFSDELPNSILIDRFLLSQILKNLLENAAKHTRAGSIRIGVRYIQKDKKLRIDIADSGRGIPAEQSQSIFQLFSDSILSEHYQRTTHSIGIGLNNSRRLARIMGGDVFLLETNSGRGATFRVELLGVEMTNEETADSAHYLNS